VHNYEVETVKPKCKPNITWKEAVDRFEKLKGLQFIKEGMFTG